MKNLAPMVFLVVSFALGFCVFVAVYYGVVFGALDWLGGAQVNGTGLGSKAATIAGPLGLSGRRLAGLGARDVPPPGPPYALDAARARIASSSTAASNACGQRRARDSARRAQSRNGADHCGSWCHRHGGDAGRRSGRRAGLTRAAASISAAGPRTRRIRARLDAHPAIAAEFIATRPRPIVHDTGRPDLEGAALPAAALVRILTELRDELANVAGPDPGTARAS